MASALLSVSRLVVALLALSVVPSLAQGSADRRSSVLVNAQAASPESTFDHKRFDDEVLKRKELPNFHAVHPYLYRSGAPDEAGLQEAYAKGVRNIIDLRNPGEIARRGDEAQWAKRLGMRYTNMPMGPEAPTRKQVETFLDEVKAAQARPEQGAVLVHCTHGSDRSGCLVGIWRVTQDGWDFEKAYDEMRHYWFTPKFVKLSGAVRAYAQQGQPH